MTIPPDAAGNAALAARIDAEQATIAAIKVAMIAQLHRFDLYQFDNPINDGLATFNLRTDPYDKSQSLCGHWHNGRGECCGNLQILGTGQVFAEFDILLAHPGDQRWFIAAVNVWGQHPSFHAELDLLPALGA
jgi:hypothetical protein